MTFPFRRLAPFAAIAGLYVGLQFVGPVRFSVAQGTQGSDSTRYNVTSDSLSIRKDNGQTVLVLHRNVRITHADVTIRSDRGTHYVDRRHTFLVGRVKAVQGSMTMWGDEGEYLEPTDVAILRGNVRIVDEGWEVTADEVEYKRTTGDAWLRGNVVARDSSSTLRAGRLLYRRDLEYAEAFDGVEVANPDEGFVARGEHGFYYRDTRQGVLDRNPRLIVDPTARDPVIVDSDTMRVLPDSGIAIAYYRVKILKGDMVTQCDSAVVYDKRQEAELIGNPLAKQNRVSMKGRHMRVFYNDDEVYRVDMRGDSEIREAHPDSLVIDGDNWMRGDLIQLFLSDNAVDSIRVDGKAVSEYRPSTPGKVERNFITGDGMFFGFESDSLAYVRVRGNAEGVYRYVDVSPGMTTDSLRALADTTLEYRSFRNAEKVVYEASEIEYFARKSDLVLKGDASLRYRASTLTGDDINYYSDWEILDARGEPQLTEDAQTFYGDRMNYDLAAQSGLVVQGSTKYDQGYFTGRHVGKGDDGSLKMWGSNYTTCELQEPHFHFRASQMKVYPNDKVVSSNLVMYIGETPIFYLPFMANNLTRGRRSGFLRPDFDVGINSRDGRFIRNIGYYWATNDYTDFTFVADFNENTSVRVFTENRYKLRYWFNGAVNYTFLREFKDFTNLWELRWNHRQEYLPWGMNFNADLHYVSDESVPQSINRIDDVDRVTDRSLRSNASLTKSFGTSVRLSLSGTRVQNLNVVDPNGIVLQQTLPNFTLSIPSRNLYFGERSRSGGAGFWEKVLSSVRYSPSLSGGQQYTERTYQFTNVSTLSTGLGFTSSPKIGFVTVSPSISTSNRTVRTDDEILAHDVANPDSSITSVPYQRIVDTENEFSWNAGVGANTNLYGTFYGRVGKLRAVRHVVSPQARYSYAPANGSRPASQAISLSLRQNVDFKVATGDTTTTDAGGKEETLQKISNIVNWTLSTSYNPARNFEDDAWSSISSSFATDVLGLGLSWNQQITPYGWTVTTQNLGARMGFRGKHPFGRSDSIEIREINVAARHDTTSTTTGEYTSDDAVIEQTGDTLPGREDARAPGALALAEGYLPWSLNVDFTLSDTKGTDPRASIRLGSQIDLTNAWSLTYGANYDISDRYLAGQTIAITRDLHCWEMSLSRQKIGEEWQFYFKIRLKAHPELYQEAGDRGLGGGTIGAGSVY